MTYEYGARTGKAIVMDYIYFCVKYFIEKVYMLHKYDDDSHIARRFGCRILISISKQHNQAKIVIFILFIICQHVHGLELRESVFTAKHE